jgi:hypothetical protein
MSISTEEIRPVLDASVKDQKEVSGRHGQVRAEFKKSDCRQADG